MKDIYEVLRILEDNNIYYKLSRIRESILIEVAVPGQRWEIEIFEDNHIEIEKFIADGDFYDGEEIYNLIKEFGDK